MTQNDKILNHLKEYGSITPRSAYDRYGIMRLGARIYDLRQEGFQIEKVMESTKNRFGEDVTYARYYYHP